MSRCTLIIVNWNSWDLLSQCLEKIKIQTYQHFSVLVIDNASSQHVPPGLLARYPNVTLIQNPSNLGFAAANNLAIEMTSDSEWVVLLNPDAFPEPDWLQRLLDSTAENPDYAMLASRQLMEGDQQILD